MRSGMRLGATILYSGSCRQNARTGRTTLGTGSWHTFHFSYTLLWMTASYQPEICGTLVPMKQTLIG